MKKMLISGLLSSVLAVSAVWGEGIANTGTSDLLFRSLAGKLHYPCDNPSSKECQEELKNDCGNDQNCINFHLKNNTSDGILPHQDIALFFEEQLSSAYNQKEFQDFLKEGKEKGVEIETILTYKPDFEKSIIQNIVEKNLLKQAGDINNVFGKLRQSKMIMGEIKGLNLTQEMKNILF